MKIDDLKNYTETSEPAKPEALKNDEKEEQVEKYVAERVKQMQDFRTAKKIEQRWKEADREYIPSEIEFETRKRYESDEETGLRSKYVSVKDEDEAWKSNNSDLTLLTKIQTAVSIIIDNNPSAVFKALTRKNENRTALAKVLWERNWNISAAKQAYKKFVFNLVKYGWACLRVYPRLVKYDKQVLTSLDTEDSTKNTYDSKTLTWYNDVDRENLNPFRTWIDEQTKPYDEYSMGDNYFEKDYSWDQSVVEFEQYGFTDIVPSPTDLRVDYTESKSTSPSSGPAVSGEAEELKSRRDIVTIGFFESRLRDLYVIRIPKLNRILHYCPLPNDDGMLSIIHTMWILRDAEFPEGVSLWEIIKQKKGLYDKMQNMTMNQLVLSIEKMGFYTGTNNLGGDGTIKIKPGVLTQMVNGKVDWMDIPGPGDDSWKGLQYVKNGLDDDSAITPTLQGQVTGQTLGETQLAKEASLKRMKVPVDNIAWAIEQDAYLSLSWMGQIYSTPEVKEFATMKEIQDYESEASMAAVETNPKGGIDEQGAAQGPFETSFLPDISLPLEKVGDKLVESRTERFFSLGKDIDLGELKWRGLIKVEPKSIVTSSSELEKQGIKETFNIIAPLLPQDPKFFAKPVKELLISSEQDPKKWLPDDWLAFLEQDHNSLFVAAPPPAALPGAPATPSGAGPMPSNQTSMQGAAGTTPSPGGPTVVPAGQINTPQVPGSTAPRQELTRMQ